MDRRPDDDEIAAVKAFLLEKWRERADERGEEPPADRSGACKFASLFAATLFGGAVRGNFFHQWAELRDGTVVDLCGDARDVAELRDGRAPDYAAAYAEACGEEVPSDLYAHDPYHMASEGNVSSMRSVEPRVRRWIAELGAPEPAPPGLRL